MVGLEYVKRFLSTVTKKELTMSGEETSRGARGPLMGLCRPQRGVVT